MAEDETKATAARQAQPSFRGQLDAMWREGLKDLQNAILPAFPDSQRGVEEPGTPLVPTQMQVTQEQGNVQSYNAMLEGYASRSTPAKDRGMER